MFILNSNSKPELLKNSHNIKHLIFRKISSLILSNVIWSTEAEITDNQRDFVENMHSFVVSTITTDGLEPIACIYSTLWSSSSWLN